MRSVDINRLTADLQRLSATAGASAQEDAAKYLCNIAFCIETLSQEYLDNGDPDGTLKADIGRLRACVAAFAAPGANPRARARIESAIQALLYRDLL